MRNLFTVLFLAVSLIGWSQQVDLMVSAVHVSSSVQNEIPPGIVSGTAISIRNNDSTIAEPGDTIRLYLDINGTVLESMHVLSASFNPGQVLYHNFGDTNTYGFSNVGEYSIQGWLWYDHDSIWPNNILTDTYSISNSVDNTISCSEFNVLDPAGLDGFDIDNHTNYPPQISEALIKFVNVGEVNYLQHTEFNYNIYLGSDSVFVEASLFEGDLSQSDTTLRHPTNLSLFPGIPDSVGFYDICASIAVPYAMGIAGCFPFEIVDLWDPTDPDNWPHGIRTLNRKYYSLINSVDYIHFRMITEPLTVSFISMNGSVVKTSTVQSDKSIALTDLASGIYVLQLRKDDQVVGQEKIIRY